MPKPIHPFYESHRAEMQATMRQRLTLAEPMLSAHKTLPNIETIKHEVMEEFETVLTQTPYVGGPENRMTDFFMRLIGFMAISRVLHKHGLPPATIGEIERETLKAQLLTIPEPDRLAAGQQFMSPENQALIREQAQKSTTKSHQQEYPEDFVYDFIEPTPTDTFTFGINYKACGFCKFAANHGDKEILPNLCGLDFAAYATRGIHLERTQTLAAGATHCNFRFYQLPPSEESAKEALAEE